MSNGCSQDTKLIRQQSNRGELVLGNYYLPYQEVLLLKMSGSKWIDESCKFGVRTFLRLIMLCCWYVHFFLKINALIFIAIAHVIILCSPFLISLWISSSFFTFLLLCIIYFCLYSDTSFPLLIWCLKSIDLTSVQCRFQLPT